MIKVKEWVEKEFNPWKKAMLDYENQEKRSISIVQKNAAELKYIVSLLLEKRESEAVKIWNELELNPRLSEIKLNLSKDELVMVSENNVEQALSIASLLEELQAILSA